MKKSTKVALTLLVPAMTAYGCGNQSKTVQAPANSPISQLQAGMTIPMTCSCGHSFTTSGDKAGKIVPCPKCSQSLTVPAGGTQASTYNNRYRSDSYYRRSTYSPWSGGWFGGYSSHTASSPSVASATHATGTNHATSVSHGSTSGFGGTGAHFSGGS